MSEIEQAEYDGPTEAYAVLMDGERVPGVITELPDRDEQGLRVFSVATERPLLPWELVSSYYINVIPARSTVRWEVLPNHVAPKMPKPPREGWQFWAFAVACTLGIGGVNLLHAITGYVGRDVPMIGDWLTSATAHRLGHVSVVVLIPVLLWGWYHARRVGYVLTAHWRYDVALGGVLRNNLHNALARLLIPGADGRSDPGLLYLRAWYSRPSAVPDGPENTPAAGAAAPGD